MNQTKFLIYESNDSKVTADVMISDETIWMTQKQMADMFEVDRTTITRHLKNIFKSEELDEKVVSAKIEHTNPHK